MTPRALLARFGRAVLAFAPLGVLGALVAANLTVVAAGSASSAIEPDPRQVVTPILSARRLAPLVAAPLLDREVARTMEELLGVTPPGTCVAVGLDGELVFAHAADEAMIPASNQKLLTAFAALRILGHDHRYRTRVLAGPIRNGVVNGDLHLVGGGDPLLVTAAYARRRAGLQPVTSLDALADAVVAAGVREVRGGVVGDDSRYDAVRVVPSWPQRYIDDREVGPLSALTVDDGFLQPSGAPAPDPAAAAAAALRGLLLERGVVIAGGATAGPVAAGAAELAVVSSAPLVEIVAQMLRDSDNGTAELVLKELGRVASGQGSTAAGAAAVTQQIAAAGIDTTALRVVDGSGLDRGNQVSCRLVAEVLEKADPALVQGLAVAGESGTLRRRYAGTPVAGRVRGKTGEIRDVLALSGFVEGRDGHVLTFSLIQNRPGAHDDGHALWNALLDRLILQPAPPDPEPFKPLPAVGAGTERLLAPG